MSAIPWGDDKFFFTHTWIDETSSFDPHPSVFYSPGSDSCWREFSARVPLGLKDCPEAIERWIDGWMDIEGEEGFWVE
jgi:hypothetical protein